MAAEPFIAIPLTKPAWMRSLITGHKPTLRTCPPSAQMIARCDVFAYRIARTRLRRLSPAKMCGSFEMNPRRFSEPSIGLPNMAALTLLFRSLMEYVETLPKSSGLRGYCEFTANPSEKFQER